MSPNMVTGTSKPLEVFFFSLLTSVEQDGTEYPTYMNEGGESGVRSRTRMEGGVNGRNIQTEFF